MNILVALRCVVDKNIKVRVNHTGDDVDIQHSKMSINPYDENALEAAVCLKEHGIATKVTAVSIGNDKCINILRNALAKGCDEAIFVNMPTNPEPIVVATILSKIGKDANLIVLGKQAIDTDSSQVGSMLSGILRYPIATSISKIVDTTEEFITIVSEVDNGNITLKMSLPAIITTDLNLNKPRFAKLPDIMAAKNKPLTTLTPDQIEVNMCNTISIVNIADGEIKKSCKFVTDINELASLLK